MSQNPNQQFQKQFQKQMQDARQRQMQAAWQQQQQAGDSPAREKGGCARAFAFVLTLFASTIGFAVLCGGGGYLAVLLATESDDTAVVGAVAGGVLALILGFIAAVRAARK